MRGTNILGVKMMYLTSVMLPRDTAAQQQSNTQLLSRRAEEADTLLLYWHINRLRRTVTRELPSYRIENWITAAKLRKSKVRRRALN